MMNILESSNLGGYRGVINEVEHQRALMMDLHDLVLPILDPCSDQAKLVQQLFEEVFRCSSKIISSLELSDNSKKQDMLTKHKRKGGENNVDNNILEENKGRGNKRSDGRKNAKHISSVVTQAPHFDGYQWRKYGQKWISKAKHSRSYYRCAYNKEQGCPATKTVQQKESGGNATVRLFDVEYYDQHICNSDGIDHPYVVEATQDGVPIVSEHNQSSSSTFINADSQGFQDESFGDLFVAPDMPEYLTELTNVEMASVAFGITSMNSPLISEDIELMSNYRCAYSKEQQRCPATNTVQQKESDGNGTVSLFDVEYCGQHICNSDGIVHPYVVEATHASVPIVSDDNQRSRSTFVNNTDAQGVQDESFGELFMVLDMPEYLTAFTDVEMASAAFEVTSMNSPLISEDIWA